MALNRETDKGRRKLRVLVISAEGSERQGYIREMFAEMSNDFEPPCFSPAVPQRGLRGRLSLLGYCQKANLLPSAEWEAIRSYEGDEELLFDCLQNVEVLDRRGSAADRQLHYSVELWRKAKGLNRGRCTLACTLAHLIAMKRLVEDDMDLILEDNVRAPTRGVGVCSEGLRSGSECARRIWATMDASRGWEEGGGGEGAALPTSGTNASSEEGRGRTCHLRYYGWLGSMPNLEWTFRHHMPNTACPEEDDGSSGEGKATVFRFPTTQDIEAWEKSEEESATTPTSENESSEENAAAPRGEKAHDDDDGEDEMGGGDDQVAKKEMATKGGKASGSRQGHARQRPGGTPLWGAYAYWISPEGYQSLIESLRSDVGALLWKGKRMRCFVPKPIDKVMPRRVPPVIHVSDCPAFFRAPMLTSQIHSQWDAEFCKSTDYQLSQVHLNWDDLWLTPAERDIVAHRRKQGVWITRQELANL